DARVRRLHDHLLLAVPALRRLRRQAGVRGRPGGRGGGVRGCVRRVPLVERGARTRLHGRRRIARDRRRDGGPGPAQQGRPAPPAARRSLRRRDVERDRPGRLVPRLPPANPAYGAHPSPLRGGRMAGVHGHRQVLAVRRRVRRAGARRLLRGLHQHPRGDRLMRVLVVGLGATGDAVVRYVRGRGDDVTVVDDRPLDARAEYARVEDARRAGAEVLAPADAATVERLAVGADLVVPSPGVPERHVALQAALAAGVAVRSEVDLAAALTAPTDPSGPRLAAITGTNGKTTVTTLTAAMLDASGVRSLAAGNIGLPLLDAARSRVDVVVAEVSSFQLVFTTPAFRPAAAALLNVADDHLDWHRTFDAYARAKARIFEHQGADDLLVFNADDPAVAALAADAPGRRVPFSVGGSAASGFRVVDGASGRMLVTGGGRS